MMKPPRYFLGIDFGTSGVRAHVVDDTGNLLHETRRELGGLSENDLAPAWRDSLWDVIASLPPALRAQLDALAVDGTSGTLVACDAELTPRAPPLLYNDARASAEAAAIQKLAPVGHPAAAATSGLAKLLWYQARLGLTGARVYLNQADWLSGLLSERVGVCDYHNALKLGLDLDRLRWPEWVTQLAGAAYLPTLVAPGTDVGTLARSRALYLGVNPACRVRAGTTDSIAAFLAAGVSQTGDAVTSLGSTLVLKLLSDTRVEASESGVYSHWFGERWLAGGASNAGGAVLRRFFSDAELVRLSAQIDPAQTSPLDYQPLPATGERFPVNDPTLAPRLTPRPADDAAFLHGLLESLAHVEAQGYARLAGLGASPLVRVETAGGGAANSVWQALRARHLGVPVRRAAQTEAAYGSARLAREGVRIFCPPEQALATKD
jgi:sugar (pentulose or hexulose) kinase